MPKSAVLYLAAGESRRFKKNKLFLPLRGEPLFLFALKTLHDFLYTRRLTAFGVFINCQKRDNRKIKKILRQNDVLWDKSPAIKILSRPGNSRHQSVFRAVEWLSKQKMKPEFLIIHNAANPFITLDEILHVLSLFKKYPLIAGVAVGRPASSTLKVPTARQNIKTLSRENVWEVETPQVVRFESFWKAHQKAKKEKFEATDDIGVLEWAGYKTAIIPASENNFKITTPRDYEFAKFLVGDFPHLLFGYGEDSHAFSRTHRGLRLAGILFKKYPKLEADSDGDVILHAVSTAILQALGKGSFGKFATPLFQQGIHSSQKYLSILSKQLKEQYLEIQKLNLIIEGKTPKIDPLASRLSVSLSQLLHIPKKRVSIAAQTGEKLTPFGRGEGLRCSAQVLIRTARLEGSIQ